MPLLILKPSDEEYLRKCILEYKCSYGIIIGQRLRNQNYYVLHLARNSEEDSDLTDSNDFLPELIQNIDCQVLVNQITSASKMISGSFCVIGIFISSDKDLDEKMIKDFAKKFFNSQCLITQNNILSNSFKDEEFNCNLILACCTVDQKSKYTIYSKSGGNFIPINCVIEEPNFEWFVFESSYELDEIFPITSTDKKINLENQLKHALASVKTNLNVSEIFIQNENVEESVSIEDYLKQKYGKESTESVFRASIFLPVNKLSQNHYVEVKAYNGTIRLSGAISSRIWCRPENTFEEIKHFIRLDIIRSIVARIQLYCDGFTEPNANFDAAIINEPPRRIYFSHPKERIQFSEYIFRGETPTVAVSQAKQILDLEIDSTCIYDDLEGLPDDDVFTLSSSDAQIRVSTATSLQLQITRSMYLLGTIVALFVLIVSILLHFTMR